ncbi:MAG TPA: zf-HC2 domain-containing protein, partial [Thermomicrobiales bacterium]|nr:zf-HC2 domain-containing protein [Thermomicrobiales bacterium]
MNDACANTRRLLSEQLDGTLTTDERAELRAHIATCPNCRAFERDLQAGLAGIARLPRVSGNSAIREAVLAGVHPGGRSAWPRGWRDWSGQLTKLGGAIAAFALVAVILMTVFNGTGEPDDHQSGAIPERPPFNIETATPEPIPTVPTNADIYAPPICHPDQVEYELQVDAFPGDPAINSPSFVRIGVHAIKSTGGMICRVEAPVTLTIADEAGEPLDIQGNPVTGIIAATLGPGDARTEFAWLNWCGAQDPFSLTAEILTSSDSETTTGQSTEVRPLCDDPNQPSILGQSSMAEATSAADSCQSGQVATEANDAGLQIWI